MQNDIKDKIRLRVGAAPYEERDVVYILVECSKLWEQLGRPDEFETVMFYRDWVAHACLDRGRVKKLFASVLDEAARGEARSEDWQTRVHAAIKSAFSQVAFSKLKAELLDFLVRGVEAGDRALSWESFQRELYEVIRDIPLRVMEGEKDERREVFAFKCVSIPEEQRPGPEDLHIEAEVAEHLFRLKVTDQAKP